MEFKDYYATLGVQRTATQDEIKRAYRKLARKYHPDVSKEPDGEARFKEVAEAYEVLGEAARRQAYDDVGSRHRAGQQFDPPPDWDRGFDFGHADAGATPDHSDFFEALFRRQSTGARGPRGAEPLAGGDHHAKVRIDLRDAYRGAQRHISWRVPQVDAQGQLTMHERQLEVNIPKGIRNGQHLRLVGQGSPGRGDAAAGDLYLEIEISPHPAFRVDGRDVYTDLPVAPWEAALGAGVTVPTPDGNVELTVPPDSAAGRKLRLKGQGIPGTPPGDLYAVLKVALPPADTPAAQAAWRALAQAFDHFNPRPAQET
jgi:curved DNA-binding protein